MSKSRWYGLDIQEEYGRETVAEDEKVNALCIPWVDPLRLDLSMREWL